LTDFITVLVGVLLSITIGAALEYYRQLRKTQKEYEKARGVVEDIILSFDRQFQREAQKLESVAYKVETAESKKDGGLKKAEETAAKLATLEAKIASDLQFAQKILPRMDEIERKTRDVAASKEALEARISSLEERTKAGPTVPEPSLQAAIPIKREKAMAQLTDTELAAMEFLALEGPRTAPEVKERVRLSREHTARLMKKLYEEGYLERDTSKIPFKYSVKKEMTRFLRKPESQAT
jgi:DNA repair ATPase RecN